MRSDIGIACIVMSYGYAGSGRWGWAASLRWIDSKWAEAGCVEGDIDTRYPLQTIGESLDLVLEIADQMGLKRLPTCRVFRSDPQGSSEEPEGWKQELGAEAAKRGLTSMS